MPRLSISYFFVVSFFLLLSFLSIVSTITKSVGLTRPALDFPLEKPSIAATADKAEGYAPPPPSSGSGSERESVRETLLFKHSKCEFQLTHPVPVPVPIPIPIPVPFFARLETISGLPWLHAGCITIGHTVQ